jgi:hypothetical protein
MSVALFLIGAIIFICGAGIGLCARDWQDGHRAANVMLVGFFICLMVVLFAPLNAWSRDVDGRYAQSPNKEWFDGLRSGKGPCCSDADGSAVSDVDWMTTGDPDRPYKVRLDGEWIPVEATAVITEPNRIGKTMVWPIKGYMGISIRCFMPGAFI